MEFNGVYVKFLSTNFSEVMILILENFSFGKRTLVRTDKPLSANTSMEARSRYIDKEISSDEDNLGA